jgi:sugar O-acyltransferase (sialic acid O-acetyltransferase NeuD family)
VVADAALCEGRWDAVCASDSDPSRCAGELLAGVTLVAASSVRQPGRLVHVAIGSAASRHRVAEALGLDLLTSVIHPAAVVSRFSLVSPGCFVAAGAVVAACSNVGLGAIVNHGAIVDHDVHLGAFSHVAPKASLGGGVKVGQRVLIGAGAVVLPGVRIADDVTIGACSVVTDNITEAGTYVGAPARRVQ